MALLTQESVRYCARCRIRSHIGRQSDVLESILSPTRLSSRSTALRRQQRAYRRYTVATASTASNVTSHNEMRSPRKNYSSDTKKMSQVVLHHAHNTKPANVKRWIQNKIETDLKPLSSVVSELNLEIPKTYENVLEYFTKPKLKVSSDSSPSSQSNPTPVTSPEDVKTCDVQPNSSVCLSPASPPSPSSRRPVHMRGTQTNGKPQVISREQFSFEEAMLNTQNSLESDSESKPATNLQYVNIIKALHKVRMDKADQNALANGGERPKRNWKTIIPNYSVPFIQKKKPEVKQEVAKSEKRCVMADDAVHARTQALLLGLQQCKNDISRLVRLEEFCRHLLHYPITKPLAVKHGAIPLLLKFRESSDQALREQALEGLTLLGHVDPVKGRGIRILTLDGGGTRGLATIELLHALEKASGERISDLFDYVCGVSTGALIAIMVGVFKVPLTECAQIYAEFARDMFSQSRLEGARQLVMSHAYYNTQLWEDILQENIGTKSFLETARDESCPKISAVSNLVNQMSIQNFMFRNYTFPVGSESHYPGSVEHKLWQAIRASSAAPGYYEEFKLDGKIHQDGGLLTNNPSALAVHECRLLWPNTPIQCVVSLGTGRYASQKDRGPNYSSLKDKLIKVVQSATDTESVHHVLSDLLPDSSYYRLNPELSDDFQMDEIRQTSWDKMIHDTQNYCRKKQTDIDNAAKQLLLPKRPDQKVTEWAQRSKTMLWK